MTVRDALRGADYQVSSLSYRQFGELVELARRGSAAFLLPLGAMQPHGPHAPIGTDILISQRMCADASRALAEDGILAAVLPGLPYGATPYFSELPGCIALRPGTVESLLGDVVSELARNGIDRCIVVNNNYTPEQLGSIYSVAAATRKDGFRLYYMDITHPWRERAAELPQAYLEGDFHAGSYETSLMLASDPGFVDEGIRTALPDLPIDLVDKIRRGFTSIEEIGAEQAYIGFPARATGDEGLQAYANLCAMLVREVRAMLSGAEPKEPGWYARAASREA